MQNVPKFDCGIHVQSESCIMNGEFGWEKIDLITALKHLVALVTYPYSGIIYLPMSVSYLLLCFDVIE